MFWIISIVLLVLAALFVLFPLWKHYRPESGSGQIRTETNLGIFEERQNELQLELDNGSLDQSQYEALLLELKKSLLFDTANLDSGTGKKPAGKSSATGNSNPNETLSKFIPVLLVVLIPLVAYLMYDRWGYLDDVRLMELYEQSLASDKSEDEALHLASQLIAATEKDDTNPWAFYFLGRNFTDLGIFEGAERAFRDAADRMPEGPDKAATLGLLAQIKYVQAGYELNDEVLALVEQARSINPSENASLQLLSIDAEAQGDLHAAIRYWRLMIQANPNSAQAQQLRERIASAQQQLADAGDAGAAAGPRIEVSVALEPGLEMPSGMRVFVAARNADQEGAPPLAAISLVVDDLPATVTLDDDLALTPAFNLSSADRIYVTATVSRTGSATVQPGDYRTVSESFDLDGETDSVNLEISLSDVVR
ncbi:MAG: c-type cytochrome biogenesis protein CcmI [Gammaproteobacteria bacterium]|nr:c-type cytochrome biogenesis protein CcmI [Pseudomonadales bacterium]MCP5345858.1 c-type cytochrome biogenesis protein CcmI [Pseudomonadales bacterium]